MDSDKSVTATFTKIEPAPVTYALTVTVVGSGSASPSGGTFDENEVVNLSATADDGWQFDGWSGGLSGTDTPIALTMESDKAVTATFSELPPNNAPVALNDDASTKQGIAIPIDVLANDTDTDGDMLAITAISQPDNGQVTQDGDKVVFTPAVGFVGTTRFTYAVSDPRGASDSATVIVAVAKEVTVIEIVEEEETVLDFTNVIETIEEGVEQSERPVERAVQTTIVIPANAIDSSGGISDTFALNFAWLEKEVEEGVTDPQEEAIPDGLDSSGMRFVIDAIVNDVLDPDLNLLSLF